MGSLTGKTALVTGGSRGIGAAIARRLAAEGASVAISYSASGDRAAALASDIAKTGARVEAFKADQAKPAEVQGLVRAVLKSFGRLDILVNNAGVYVTGTVDDPAYDAAAFDRQLAINVGGVAAAVREAAKVMGRGGRIVNIGSVIGERAGWPGVGDYGATKAAVALYSRGWARDLGPKGVTVNTVQPGPIDTEMNPADGPNAAGITASLPLGRYGKAEEVAAAVAFLAGPEAGFITGATLNVDGGYGA